MRSDPHNSDLRQEPIGELLKRLSNETTQLLRQELELAKAELAEKGKTAGQGATSTITVALKPGKYTFYCPVDAHKQAGMKGTLTVK